MHDLQTRQLAIRLSRDGIPYPEIAARCGVPRGTVGYWASEDRRRRGVSAEPCTHCPRCGDAALDGRAYSYLLGLYLGDGHIAVQPRTLRPSITCCDDWPELIDLAEQAMRAVLPERTPGRRQRTGCTDVVCSSKHWLCLFPQHGPGLKSDRPIVLADWQRAIQREHPWELVRGLIHSDGCRVVNWTVSPAGRRYEYPRYHFTNKSDDIRRIYTDTLDLLGVEWREARRGSRPWYVSVARRASVALMDAHVGPKH